jgi:hypothetical protein
MLLGLTQHLTGNEGREKKEKKTTKRAAAAAAKEKETAHSATGAGSADEHVPDIGGGEGLFTSRSSKRQRRAVVIKAEEKVRIT